MDLSLSGNDPGSGVFSLRRGPAYVRDPGAFDLARVTFEWLVTGPHPVSVDGRSLPGLPLRQLLLDELGQLMLATGCTQATRDAVWAYLITRSRAEGGTWTVACVGLALPVLLPIAAELTRRFRGEVHDIHSAVLTGFLDGLGQVDLGRPAILVRLRWTAYRAGSTALREALNAPAPVDDLDDLSGPPPRPSGHPDFVLVRAVDEGAITGDEAALIGATRFGELSLAQAAACRGQSYEAAKKARQRAEARLAAHLTGKPDEPETRAWPATGHHTTHPTVRISSTRRVRLRTVTRTNPELAEKLRRPVSRHGAKSGVRTRGDRGPAHPRSGTSRPAGGLASTQEAPSCN